jgi:hypothetical protein
MYEQYFDEAEEYTTQEVLRRAYALGVASVCEDPDEAAYEKLKRRSPDTYDESIVELAYEEGRAEALQLEASEEADDEIWERLVEKTFQQQSTDESTGTPDGLPEALSGPDGIGPDGGLPDRLDLPSFLRR